MAEQMTEPEDRQSRRSAEPIAGVDLPDQERFARTGETARRGRGRPRRGRRSSSSPT